jgi:hypothetical protein
MTDHDDCSTDEEFIDYDLSEKLKRQAIYETKDLHETIPAGFQAVTIYLDATAHSSLNWQKEIDAAHKFIEQGYDILFDLDLGLFNRLETHLNHEVQFQTLSFAMDHFSASLTPEIKKHTLGVLLARLDLEFQNNFKEIASHELDFQEWLVAKGCPCQNDLINHYFRDVAVEYILLLVTHLPLSITPLVLVDAQNSKNPLTFAQLTAKDRFERIQLAIKNPLFAQGYMVWEEGSDFGGYIGRTLPPKHTQQASNIGLLIPSYDIVNPVNSHDIDKALEFLLSQNKNFKIISEELLTNEWDGLDALIVSPATISSNSKRKLQGFFAAGGKLVSLGLPLGFIESEPFEIWSMAHIRSN